MTASMCVSAEQNVNGFAEMYAALHNLVAHTGTRPHILLAFSQSYPKPVYLNMHPLPALDTLV